ncbi:N-acetylglucosaminyldiphosphoundecaprenol N-acetyl-beta-D-mannosaminyltransferase [Desulfosarcina sp. BuS5]|uniref:WecB/TagA/CpsF family glycosyltransferase n=1 Tax=Desulfosarcina sp. BuS5 TaxID=933262 RepID=UPI00048561A7|nr:WecB/TagA/CpsF family glycosyltransferase [Desulfosarcina sp. BuS5]WDN88272.1 N-acetylglucosaminyldiphosphoundecaprenol N-acetyl-beta-D-mannosaminyltransferase [Desulfosarcina sp. BuS5]
MKNRLDILNIWVDPVNREQAVRLVEKFLAQEARPHSIFASNPEKNFTVPKDLDLYKTFKEADLLLPDGIGMVLAARILHKAGLTRVPGSEFIFDLCRLAEIKGYKIFLYGAKEEVSRAAADKLQKQYPDLVIAGRENGYLKEPEMPDLIGRINESGAEILFIALGSPMQEKWYAVHKNELTHVRVCQAIGGTLDTIAGNVKRAPELWCKFSLEWLYRLLSEPKRIKRQKVLPVFAIMILVRKLKAMLSLEKK